MIKITDISFSYPDSSFQLDIGALSIARGEKAALIGSSGIGKTTLISLLLRFYRTAEGEIYFDGLPASDYNTASLRRRIGYASQDPKILSGTVIENLCYGNPDAGKEQILQAARITAIHDDIEKLPKGYETVIGEKGLNLSEGQKQRLSIARALIKEPDILILDEPTSALDSMTEKSIFDALPSQVNGKTVLVASHRISTIKHADRILILNESGIADIGTHETLLESSDYYRSIVAYQEAGSLEDKGLV